MNRHTAAIGQNQDRSIITVNIGVNGDYFGAIDKGIKPAPEDQRKAFLAKFPEDWSMDRIKRSIIMGWRLGYWPANDAVNWLVICGFIKPARRANINLWLENYALHHIGSVALPESFQPQEEAG